MSRVVPQTALRSHYKTLGSSLTAHQSECRRLIDDPGSLVKAFRDAVHEWADYRNPEGFYPPRREGDHAGRPTDAIYTQLKRASPIEIPGASCRFEVCDREIGPDRTTKSQYEDGTSASNSGKGGIDYVAVSTAGRPIVGEIKTEKDKDVFYALVQSLTYVSELAPSRQFQRAREHLFANRPLVNRWDIHLLLVPPRSTGVGSELVGEVQELAKSFHLAFSKFEESELLGDIYCLAAQPDDVPGTMELVWRSSCA